MAPVRGRPFLDYLLTWLQREGVKVVILCVGYKRTQIQRFVGGGRKWGLRVKYSIERKLLGTGGAVKKAEKLVSGNRLLVVNGDTFVDVRLKDLMKFHQSRRAVATLTAVKKLDIGRYGALCVDNDGRIRAFVEKGRTGKNKIPDTKNPLINGGLYLFEKKLLKLICPRLPVSLEREVFPILLSKKSVYGFECDGYFLDIGVPEDLERAQDELPKRLRIGHPR
jgi:NDP-sugar pyrophosphorylase family protein